MSALALPTGRVGLVDVLRLAWPVLVSMLSFTAMELADTLFTGWLGTAELAAVGLSTTLTFFVLTPGRGLLRGVKIITAQRTGAEDDDAARRLLAQAVWMGLALGVLGMLLTPFGGTVFWLFGASPEVASFATVYFVVRVAFAPVSCLVWALEGWFQGRGDTRTPMVATVLGNVLNVVLDPILIFGWGPMPELGIAGAAWATVVAHGAALAVLAWSARGVLPWRSFGLRWDLLRKVVHVGLPLSVQWTLDFGGFLVLLTLLARSGDVDLAAHVLVFRIVHVSVLPGYAIADAAGVLVGQAVGARRPAAAREAWWAGTRLASMLMVGFGVLFLLVPRWLVLPFDPAPEVMELAVVLLALGAAWQLFDALVLVGFTTLTSAGDTRFTLALFVGGSWLVNVPLSIWTVGVLEWGAVGAWIALTCEIAVVGLICLARVRSRAWLERRIAVEEVEPQPEVPVGVPAPA